MEQETKRTLKNYGICVAVEIVIGFLVIWSKGFFAYSAAVNLQILSDAFFVSGLLMTLFAGLLFVSGEGALIGVSYVLRNVVLFFIPLGRLKHENYGDYRERKLAKAKKRKFSCITVTGLVFLSVGIILTVIWYYSYFNMYA